MENFVGEIRMFPYNNLPRGWYYCDGTTLTVSRETQKLFDYIKYTYGGQGDQFALPDLRGSLALCANDVDPGRPKRQLGSTGGVTTNTLVEANLPAHTHTIRTRTSDDGTSSSVSGNFLGRVSILRDDAQYAAKAGQLVKMDREMLLSPTQAASFSIEQPVLGLVFAIAYQGISPTRP